MKFPKWRPDAPDLDDGSGEELRGLVTCRNVYPFAGGYKPFFGLVASTGTLPAAWVGGGAFEYNGITAMLGATNAALYSHAAGAWTSKHVISTAAPWFYSQFGDRIICTNNAAVVKYTISTGLGALLGGSPPSAAYSAIVRDFVFLAGDSGASSTVTWSAIDNAEGWTVGTNQSDNQIIPDGGPITGLAGGEYGLAFQADQINIFEYVGSPVIFTRRNISNSIGCIAHGSIAQFGGSVFFLSRRGFYRFDPSGGPVPIGENAVDDTFLGAYTSSQIRSNIRCVVDPDRNIVIWSMPDRLWIYNWAEDSWSDVSVSGLVGVFTSIVASATLESIAVPFPSLEDVTPSLDDAFWNSGGRPLLMLMKTDFIGHTFSSGSRLEATWKTQKAEPFPNRVAHVRSARMLTDAVGGITVNIDTSARSGDSQTRVSSVDLRANSDIPLRASGKVVQAEFMIAAGTAWNYAKGFEIEASPGGRL